MFVLESPVSSFKELVKLIGQLGATSGYKINENKSIILWYNIPLQMKQDLADIIAAKWQDESIRHLGVKICQDNQCMIKENIDPVVTYIEHKCTFWEMYKFSWLGHVAAVKMFPLAKRLFIF